MNDRPLATHNIHKRNIYTTGRIRTRIASNQAAADLRAPGLATVEWHIEVRKYVSEMNIVIEQKEDCVCAHE